MDYDIKQENFLYWYNKASQEEVLKTRRIYQKTIDSLLKKYNVPPVNFQGVVFSERRKVERKIDDLCDFIAERIIIKVG